MSVISVEDRREMARVIGERIRALREASGMSQSECARRIGMDPTDWNALENGRRGAPRVPSIPKLVRVAMVLECRVADLVEDL